MFSHVMVGANDLNASRKFYDAVLGALGIPAGVTDEKGRIFYLSPTGVFAITKPINGAAATAANGGTVGFTVADPAVVDAWHAAGITNGGRPARNLRACARVASGRCTSPTCGIRPATSFAPFIEWAEQRVSLVK